MLLFDQNISFRIVRLLKEAYPACVHLSRCGLLDAEDQTIWEYARDHSLAIVSFDQDFIDLAALHGTPPKVILLRPGNTGTLAVAHLLLEHQARILEFLREKATSTPGVLELP